jgi:hypothetical protein
MRSGRIGGTLVIGGWLLFLITGAVVWLGGSAGLGGTGLGSLTLGLGLALLGAGAAITSLAGSPPFRGPAIRVGLAILAVGLLSSTGSSLIASLSTRDPLESWPVIILFVVGSFASLVGAVIAVISLLLASGRSRSVGLTFAIGVGLLSVAAIVGSQPDVGFPLVVAALVAIGGCAVLAAGIGVGLLVLNGERPATATAE